MSSHLFYHFFTLLVGWTQECGDQIKTLIKQYWHKFTGYFRKLNKEEAREPGGKDSRSSYGNIALPTTGEEALKRLLASKGKDPYSILGVTQSCTDEDVKKYYKRQAFLVHPDKNKQPGAEEAFKILGHAFERIGEPERRKEYDQGLTEEVQEEESWNEAKSELASFLTQLKEELNELANTIPCSNCHKGGHCRSKLPQRPIYAARNCAECQTHHAAKEGDIWAESTTFGLWWSYFSCMEGAVYDISEWAACNIDNLGHIQANSHSVKCRISQSGKKNNAKKNRDRDLAGLINDLCKENVEKNYPGGDSGGQYKKRDQWRKRNGNKRK